MVTEFGMSDSLGAINYDGNKRARFLDMPMPQDRGMYGDDTAKLIDAEIKRILTDAHNTAREILNEHRDKLETVTRRLLVVEVMEGDELRDLLGVTPAKQQPSQENVPLPPIET
jgi:cell division protease FtsH